MDNIEVYRDLNISKIGIKNNNNNNNSDMKKSYELFETLTQVDNTQLRNLNKIIDFAQPPIPFGHHVEPNHHFFTNETLENLESIMQKILEELDIEHELSTEEFCIKCYFYNNVAKITFRINFFTSFQQDQGKYIVEIQRLYGDAIKFYDVFSLLNEKITKTGLITHPKTSMCVSPTLSTLSDIELPPLDDLNLDELDEKENQNGLIPLIQMLESKYDDVATEAINAIGDLIQSERFVETLLNLNIGNILQKKLKCENENIYCAAISILCDLCQVSTHLSLEIIKNEESMYQILLFLEKLPSRQITRKCLRLISFLIDFPEMTQAQKNVIKSTISMLNVSDHQCLEFIRIINLSK